MKKILTCTFAFAAMAVATVSAQTTNYAISNADGTGKVSVFTITELDECSEATFQMWLKPSAWTQATLIGQDNFSIEMGATAGQFIVSAGDKSATITAANDLVNTWSQLTVTISQGVVNAYINNESASVAGDLDAPFDATTLAADELGCVIAEGFRGELDEIRVWTRALDQEDFFWQNTLNKWNNNYDALAAYWKCDQDQCENLVDYKHITTGGHHGEFDGITRVEVTDNAAFRYRGVSGYVPSIMRFTDRPYISRDMFLLTNDAILLSAKVQEDGSLFPEFPDNTATPTNVDYIDEWKGRKGVMSFNGEGSQMVSADARVPFDPTAKSGHGPSQKASIEAWIYIDEWVEGAEIYSNYISDDECVIIKLGSEANKELVVDLCGTTGTLADKLEVGKWQYVGAYLQPARGSIGTGIRGVNPIYIGIGEYDENGEFVSNVHNRMSTSVGTVTVGGNDMTITNVPNFEEGATMTIGKNFKGKIDELKIWGSNRSGAIASDATKEYTWNTGVWDDIFLCAYFKGDDAENIGKDSQSVEGVIDFMRGYYANYRGAKIRIGIISSLDNSGWRTVYDNDEHLANLVRDAKKMLAISDGLDVDLEWSYSDYDWRIYNNVVRHLIEEVMVEAPEKVFSCSLHEVSYAGFDKSSLPGVDYFTFQQYGPNIFPTFDRYKQYGDAWIAWGFGKDKIDMSYATLTMTGSSEEGYKDLFDKYGYDDETFDPDLDTWTVGGTTYHFTGITQLKQKAQYVVDNDLHGIMYFDMANDVPMSDYKSLIRAQNEVISANVDTLVTKVTMKPSGVNNVLASKKTELFTAVQNGETLDVTLADGDVPATLAVYAVDGRAVMQQPLNDKVTSVAINNMQNGVYLLRVTQGGEKHAVKIAIR